MKKYLCYQVKVKSIKLALYICINNLSFTGLKFSLIYQYDNLKLKLENHLSLVLGIRTGKVENS